MNVGYKLYCDLDGVLVDFRRGYKDLTGKYPPPPRMKYDKKSFWKPIDEAKDNFWEALHWTNDGKRLWNYIKKFNPEILSSPSSSKTSIKGKKAWMSKNLPGVKLNLEQSSKKHLHARGNAVLIDDREDICEKWIAAGGIAIHHKNAESTIKKLKNFKPKARLAESKVDIENEIFSAYNGRYIFDITKAYDLIESGKIKAIKKTYKPDIMHFLSHPEFSATDSQKLKTMEVDYDRPIGLIVNFENPETSKTEYLLVDGNHRTRKAVEEGKPAIFLVVQDPKDTEKFMTTDTSKAHQLFPQDDDE
jgi:hypothetical protein